MTEAAGRMKSDHRPYLAPGPAFGQRGIVNPEGCYQGNLCFEWSPCNAALLRGDKSCKRVLAQVLDALYAPSLTLNFGCSWLVHSNCQKAKIITLGLYRTVCSEYEKKRTFQFCIIGIHQNSDVNAENPLVGWKLAAKRHDRLCSGTMVSRRPLRERKRSVLLARWCRRYRPSWIHATPVGRHRCPCAHDLLTDTVSAIRRNRTNQQKKSHLIFFPIFLTKRRDRTTITATTLWRLLPQVVKLFGRRPRRLCRQPASLACKKSTIYSTWMID